MKPPTETALVRACLQLLALRGIVAWRQNVTAAVFGSRGGRRFVRSCPVGVSDVLGIIPRLVDREGNERRGVFLALEAKMPGNSVTDAQLAFLRNVRAAGGVAVIAYSVQDLAEALGREGAGG
jgi:hypothetical protein